jgi:signal transduction histidine kinase
MNRLLPRSLFGQTLLVLLTGLLVSHAVGSWIYTADREQAVRAVGGFAAAQRIANLTRLVHEAPRDWRERIVAALNDQAFQVSLSAQPPRGGATVDNNAAALAIKQFLVEQLPAVAGRQPYVAVSLQGGSAFAGRHPMMGHGPMMHGFGTFGGFRDLQVAMPLPDGQWLTFATALPDTGPAVSRQFLVSMAVMAVIMLGVSIWVVRGVAAPLTSLAAAADRLGKDMAAAPLPETGTIEMRQASRAFNSMQVRLRNLIDNRTRLLASISHDLRTPLTLLRLRAENVADPNERDKMLSTIAEMNSMIESTLKFARDETVAEPRQATDVAALVQSIADDMDDAGLPVVMEPAEATIIECRPAALKRALTNLIENAVKYGRTAHIAVGTTSKWIEITIDDDGPGIPESELKRVLEPFYRVEESRSRDTGGVGLGLAIALSAIQLHGGELLLSNRPSGGLRAVVRLAR